MTATLNQSQADLPKLVELASQGEDVLITVDGLPKAKLTRADGFGLSSIRKVVEMSAWLSELEDTRRRYSTGKTGLTIEQILQEDRADRV